MKCLHCGLEHLDNCKVCPMTGKVIEREMLSFDVDGVKFNMIKVEGGSFNMGSDEENAFNNERPLHTVRLTSDYHIGETQVTQALWEKVMGTTVSQQRDKERDKVGNDDLLFGVGDNYPMYYVSWEECQHFIIRLNSKLKGQLGGKRFALPTEAQWEFAARGGNGSMGYTYSGSNDIDEVAWYRVNTDYEAKAVAMLKPNELGIYDMSGNVWEWCQDRHDYGYPSSPQTNPTGSSSGSYRVLRGGSWNRSPFCSRVCHRNCRLQTDRNYCFGFRLAIITPNFRQLVQTKFQKIISITGHRG